MADDQPTGRIASEAHFLSCISEIAEQLIRIGQAAGDPEEFLDNVDRSLLAILQQSLASLGGENVEDRAALLDALFEDAVLEAKERLRSRQVNDDG